MRTIQNPIFRHSKLVHIGRSGLGLYEKEIFELKRTTFERSEVSERIASSPPTLMAKSS